MTIVQIKTKMLNWKDFYGGDLPYDERIKDATTKEELAKILEGHRRLMEDMLCDANAHLDQFKSELGLNFY